MKTLKRWLRRFALGLMVFVVVVAAIVYGLRAYMDRVGSRELAAVTKRLDTEEAGWKLESIETARKRAEPPQDQNSAPIVMKVAELMSSDQSKAWSTWRNSEEWTILALSPHLPSEQFQKGMQSHKESTVPARLLARDLYLLFSGYYPMVVDQNPYMTLLPHVQKVREVASLIEYDALLAALEHDPDRAITSAYGVLNASRSIGDEPTLISQLVRMAGCRLSTQSTFQILAWGEPKRGLAGLQAAYRAEADVPFLLFGLRGERASLHRAFEGLESGKLTADDLAIVGLQKPGPWQHAALHLYKGLLPGDHAKSLELITAYIAAAKLPHHEQRAAFAAIPIPPGPPDDFRYIITRLLIPACDKVATAGIRSRAELLAASTAIACERFRQVNGRWPQNLSEIPDTILPGIPIDPYDGQPLRYRRFEDGIAVFSIGDGDPNTAKRQVENKDPLMGLGLGWRLWNPEKRGLPPLPEPKLEPNDPPEEEPKQP